MNIPGDWIFEAELAQQTGVANNDEDRRKFHRNLANWRQHWLLLKLYDGLPVPSVRPLGIGNGPGNEAWYPPITIAMVHRINELGLQFPKNMDEWLWHLWLEGYPSEIVG